MCVCVCGDGLEVIKQTLGGERSANCWSSSSFAVWHIIKPGLREVTRFARGFIVAVGIWHSVHSFLMFNDNNWNTWMSMHCLWDHHYVFLSYLFFQEAEKESSSFCKQGCRAQRGLKICQKSHRKAVVELVSNAKGPECHLIQPPLPCPLC